MNIRLADGTVLSGAGATLAEAAAELERAVDAAEAAAEAEHQATVDRDREPDRWPASARIALTPKGWTALLAEAQREGQAALAEVEAALAALRGEARR